MSAPRGTGRLGEVLLFGYLWLTVGFALGTLTLFGPVRWVATLLRARGAAQSAEDLVQRVVIGVFVLISLITAVWLYRRVRSAARRTRLGVPAATTAAAAVALLLWLNPRLVNADGGSDFDAATADERFVFGPYPDEDRLRELKREGYTGVISLLHPLVVPFEPKLLADERRAAAKVGIALIHAPMLPWVSGNEASVAKIRALADAGTGRYYVHCYLGRDRVNVVRHLLRDPSAPVAAVREVAGARRVADMPAFERGGIYHLADSVHVGPYPTDEEWFGYLLNGSVRQVLALLDPVSGKDTTWIAREKQLASRYRVPVEILPIRALPYDPAAALQAAQRARSLPRPLYVHGFLTVSPAVEAFVQAYRTGLPPLPPSLFVEPMRAGAVRILGVNVAAGPRPTGPEFGAYLQQRGVRGVLFVGTAGAPGASEDRAVARSIGLSWQAFTPDAAPLLDKVRRGGPWYLYGPDLALVEPQLAAHLDPAVPDTRGPPSRPLPAR